MRKIASCVVTLAGILMLVPLVLMVIGSFGSKYAVMLYGFIPTKLSVEAWTAFGHFPLFRWFANSLMITSASATFVVVTALLVAFGIGHYRFRGKSFLLLLVIVPMLVPQTVTMLPGFLLRRTLGLYNTRLAVVLPGVAGGIMMLVAIEFMGKIPRELFDMAQIDGAGEWRKFISIAVPLAKPIAITVAITTAFGAWNGYLPQMLYLRREELYTVPLGVSKVIWRWASETARDVNSFPLVLAGGVVGMLPLLILFLVLQRHFAVGIFHGGSK